MPRYNVEFNEKWACFSSIADGFITPLLKKADYEKWRLAEYGRAGYKPVEQCNVMTMKEAVYAATLHNSHRESIANLQWIGLSETEVLELIGKYGCE